MSFFYQLKNKSLYLQRKDCLNFSPHLHYHVEISFLLNGECSAFVSGRNFSIKSGDVFIVFPNQIHFFSNSSPDMDAFVLTMSPTIFPEFENILLKFVPESPLITNTNKFYIHELILKAYHADGRFSNAISRSYCSILLGTLFNDISFVDSNSDTFDITTLNKIINYCAENYHKNISLNDISASLHLSTWRISHIFNELLNIPFRKLVNAFRLSEAEQLLVNSNLSIIDISLNVGFENVRTFNRCFLAEYGCSPSEFRNEYNKLN